jgi:hypothetical protein
VTTTLPKGGGGQGWVTRLGLGGRGAGRSGPDLGAQIGEDDRGEWPRNIIAVRSTLQRPA